jgi:hypothetical protein
MPALFSLSPFLVSRSNTISLSLSTSFRKSKLSNLLGSRKRRFAARKKSGKIRASPEMSISPFLLLQNIRASSAAAIAVSTKFPGLSSSKSADEEEEEEGRAARVLACYY